MDQKSQGSPLPHPTFPDPKSEDLAYARELPAKPLGSFSTFEIVTTALLIDRDKALTHPKLAFKRALQYLSTARPMVEALIAETGESEWVSGLDAKLDAAEADWEKVKRGELEGFVELSKPVKNSPFFQSLKENNPPGAVRALKTVAGFVKAIGRHPILCYKFAKNYYIREDSVRRFVELEHARIKEADSRDQRRSRGRQKKLSKQKSPLKTS